MKGMTIFNLIATTYRGAERHAKRELLTLLASLGDPTARVRTTFVAGVITAQTSLDPFTVVSQIAGKYFEDAMSLRYLIRVIPIETVTETDVGRIAEAAWKLAYRIGIQESFRITVEKRRAIIHSIDIIKAVAQKVDRRVDLENPDWIILIEVIGSTTGVSVLRPNQLFHALKPQAKPIREVRL